nr:uncharacterized protein LOC105335664 [Crassostrea gigas]XP_034324737.1 uncharacterized protein LOC105335664 [Crassostrea gigas]
MHCAQTVVETCTKHGDLLDMFCVDCEENICITCVQQNHRSHDWNRKNKILDRLKSELADQCHLVRQKEIPSLQTEIQKIKRLKSDNEKEFAEEIEKISSHTEAAVMSLHKLSKDLIRHCELFKSVIEENLEEKQKEIETIVFQFECSLKGFEEEIKTSNLSELLQIKKKMISVPHPKNLNKEETTLQHINFTAGEIKENLLRSILGKVDQTSRSVTVSKLLDAKIGIKRFKYISPISQTHAWCREFGSSENVLIDITKGSKEMTCSFGEYQSAPIPEDIITLKNGDNIYTWHAGHCVMKISPSKLKDAETVDIKVTKLVDISPLFPVGICASSDNRFLVSAIDTPAIKRDSFTKDQPQKSVVILLTEKGKIKKKFQYQNDNKTPLFLYPYRIAENTNGDICVIDLSGTNNGHLVVLSSSGQLKFQYRGTGPNQADFDPRGICCDSAGHILLGDCNNRRVHLLNEKGSFLTYLIKTDEELWSMSLFSTTLWIGGENGFVYVYHYQLNDP